MIKSSPRRTYQCAFSLVEVVLAIGIFAIAIVSLVGLLAVATRSDGESNEQTLLVTMTQQVMGDLRGLPFDLLWLDKPASGLAAYLKQPPNTKAPSGNPAESVYYFASEGVLTTVDETDFTRRPLYECVVRKTVDPKSLGYQKDARYHLLNLELRFTWPVQAPFAKRHFQAVYENVARY